MKVWQLGLVVVVLAGGLVGVGASVSHYQAVNACNDDLVKATDKASDAKSPGEMHAAADETRSAARLIWTDSALRDSIQRVAGDMDDAAELLSSSNRGHGMSGAGTLADSIDRDTSAMWKACKSYKKK